MGSGVSVVFAGGGARTFWELGLFEAVRGRLPPVDEWAGTSAGSAMAICAASGQAEETVNLFCDLTSKNPRNVYPEWIFRGQRPFPHNDMYSMALRTLLTGGAWDRLKDAGPVRFLLAYIRKGNPMVSTWLRAAWNYERRKHQRVHGPDEPFPGVASRVVTAQEAGSLEDVVTWVLSASSTPPLTDIHRYDGQPYVDGGLVDNVPVRALSPAAQEQKVLVLLSRPTRPELLPKAPNRLYLAPSAEIPIRKWDYTNPVKIRETVALGVSDAKRYEKEILKFVE